jgi:hypothetical protein
VELGELTTPRPRACTRFSHHDYYHEHERDVPLWPTTLNVIPDRDDTCRYVSNPTQDKWYCRTDVVGHVCNAACATGCTDATADTCTTPVGRRGRPQPCKRCSTGFHPVGASKCVADVSGQTYDCRRPQA